jgi:hypothetical protein
MSYFYEICIDATSEQIQEIIQSYTQEYRKAQKNRNEAVNIQDFKTASKYDVEVREFERALDKLSADLDQKKKEEANGTKPKIKESIEDKKKQIEDLIQRLSDIIKTL